MRLQALLACVAWLVVASLLAGHAGAAELVMFEDPGCPWCRRWHREIGPAYAATEEGKRAPLRRVLIKDQDRAGVALERPVTATPTFVLVEDGRELARIVGYPGEDFFYGLLGSLLNGQSDGRRRSDSLLPFGARLTGRSGSATLPATEYP